MKPTMSAGGHISLTTSGSATYVAFGNQACRQLTIGNDTGTDLYVRVGGSGAAFPVLDGTYYTFFGLENANELQVKRKDDGAAVTVLARWEG